MKHTRVQRKYAKMIMQKTNGDGLFLVCFCFILFTLTSLAILLEYSLSQEYCGQLHFKSTSLISPSDIDWNIPGVLRRDFSDYRQEQKTKNSKQWTKRN